MLPSVSMFQNDTNDARSYFVLVTKFQHTESNGSKSRSQNTALLQVESRFLYEYFVIFVTPESTENCTYRK